MSDEHDTGPKSLFVGVNREENPPRLSDRGRLLAIWTAELDAARGRVEADLREWVDVNVWGKKP